MPVEGNAASIATGHVLLANDGLQRRKVVAAKDLDFAPGSNGHEERRQLPHSAHARGSIDDVDLPKQAHSHGTAFVRVYKQSCPGNSQTCFPPNKAQKPQDCAILRSQTSHNAPNISSPQTDAWPNYSMTQTATPWGNQNLLRPN